MKKYISLSKYPGKTGQYYYTKFFKHYGIDAVYTPYGTENIAKSLDKAVNKGVLGISVSMPYKTSVIDYIDNLTDTARIYNTVNTITNDNGILTGFNADFAGVEWACKQFNTDATVTVLGNGSMGKMFTDYLQMTHAGEVITAARSADTWSLRLSPANVVINATALGTSTTNSPFKKLPPDVSLVIDLAISDNNLKKQCMKAGVKYVGGGEFYKQQFLSQFEIYTGILPAADVFDRFSLERL